MCIMQAMSIMGTLANSCFPLPPTPPLAASLLASMLFMIHFVETKRGADIERPGSQVCDSFGFISVLHWHPVK